MRFAVRSNSFSFRSFVRTQVFGSVLLLLATITALIWANTPWHGTYDDIWSRTLTLGIADIYLTETLHHWVNDGLMAIFFLVVGLEIKRELSVGELSSRRLAALPVAAAVGGVIVPAAIYLLLNTGHEGSRGWGIPMATDIAFALGVLALLGPGVPLALKVFLSALAIVDDIFAVLVIAVAYTDTLDIRAIAAAVGFMAILVIANRSGIRQPYVYALLGIGLWAAVYQSGIHATIAGVLLALVIPSSTRIDQREFVRRAQSRLGRFEAAQQQGANVLTDGNQQEVLAELEDLVEAAGAPSQRLEHALHPWVSYLIVPLFALANAGIRFDGDFGDMLANRITLGIVLGLVIGKVCGVLLGSWLSIRAGWSAMPGGVTWPLIFGMSWLGGIGFTMSLFISDLAFTGPDQARLQMAAKSGILFASLTAEVIGFIILRRGLHSQRHLPDVR